MLKKSFLKSFIGCLFIFNFAQVHSMELKDIATSEPAKIFYAASAYLGCSLLIPTIAKIAMKKIAVNNEISDMTNYSIPYSQMLSQDAKKIAKDFVTKSLPLGLLITACTNLGSLPKFHTKATAILIPWFSVLATVTSSATRDKRLENTVPGGLDKEVKIYQSLINFPEITHWTLLGTSIAIYGYRYLLYLANID